MSEHPVVNRRALLIAGLSAGAVAAVPAAAPLPATAAAVNRSRALRVNPFTLGVASGDPGPDGFVIWTRLAVAPLAGDGMGGMPNRPLTVEWEVAEDPRFATAVRRGECSAMPRWGFSVHVELSGLRAGREHWYRFKADGFVSPVGRARTAPPAETTVASLAMSFASCSNYEHGYFTAYRRLAQDHPDVVLFLGDYQYEGIAKDSGNPRAHIGPETETLANYRQRYAQYKTDPDLQAAHAVAPWLAVWDDHEVDNNWADETPERPDLPQPNFLARRKAAFRAFYENMPLRRASVPRGIDLQLYRRVRWGRLVTFHLLDTRQYRDDQVCGDNVKTCPAATDPRRSITGAAQERWLLTGLRDSGARWDLLGQQVFFAQKDMLSGPTKLLQMDAWDGYPANRDRLTRGWIDAKVRNPVVLTGDVHAHWAANLKLNYDDPASPTVGGELVCSSITSGGDGGDSDPATNNAVRLNPHLRFFNNQRGYVRTTITPDTIHADFRVVPSVTTRDAPVYTRASFVIEDRVPGLHQTYDRPRDG